MNAQSLADKITTHLNISDVPVIESSYLESDSMGYDLMYGFLYISPGIDLLNKTTFRQFVHEIRHHWQMTNCPKLITANKIGKLVKDGKLTNSDVTEIGLMAQRSAGYAKRNGIKNTLKYEIDAYAYSYIEWQNIADAVGGDILPALPLRG